MSKVRFLEGLRAPLFFAALGGLCLAPLSTATAQPVDREDLALCAAMSTEARKLACFESLLTEQPADAGAAAAEVAPAPPAVDAAPPVTPTPETAPTREPASIAEPAATAAPPPPSEPEPAEEFGSEYVKEEKEKEAERKKTVSATVNEVTTDRVNRLVFHFANGQVWRQLEARRFQYPKKTAFDVVIGRGVLGDYQLRVGGEGRMTRIKRLK